MQACGHVLDKGFSFSCTDFNGFRPHFYTRRDHIGPVAKLVRVCLVFPRGLVASLVSNYGFDKVMFRTIAPLDTEGL